MIKYVDKTLVDVIELVRTTIEEKGKSKSDD